MQWLGFEMGNPTFLMLDLFLVNALFIIESNQI